MSKQLTLLGALLFFAAGLAAQVSVASVQEVYQIFQQKCVSCHDHASPEANLDLEGSGATALLRAQNVAQNLVNFTPNNAHAAAQGHKRIYPGRPDRSFLFRKINGDFEPAAAALHANEGSSMPAYPGTPLTELEKEVLRQWILYGAQSTGTQFDKSLLETFYSGVGEKAFPGGPPPAPAPGEGFQVKMGPFYLPPDGELEFYQKYELALPANLEVNRLDVKISNYSHHYLLYYFTSAAGAAAIPHGLRAEANHQDIGLFAAVQEATDLQLPEKTAFRWDQNIVLDLNSHYINYSLNKPYQAEAYVNVYTQASGTAEQEMYAALLVNGGIYIPNNGNVITETAPEFDPTYQDSIYIWGLMGHTHKYGTGYKVWKRLPNGQKGELIYDASCGGGVPGCPSPYFDYQHIPLRYWLPLLPLRWNHGLIHEATYINDGPNPVWFGPTSDDEMMVLIAFYTLDPVLVANGEPAGAPGHEPVQIRPNPAGGHATVVVPGTNGVRLFRMFDLAGREVLRRAEIAENVFELDLGGLPAGLYWFDADGRMGKVVVSSRP